MNRSEEFLVRTMSADEIAMSIEWAAAEGWNPGWHDPQCFSVADPAGFFIGVWRGEPVASLSAVAYDAHFGFIGLYIVKPAFRGRGFGIRVWQHGMHYLGNRNIGLDGVVAQQANYGKAGFRLAYRNIRYQGRVDGIAGADAVAAADIPLEQLLAYDRRCFPRRASVSFALGSPSRMPLRSQRSMPGALSDTASCAAARRAARSARYSPITRTLPRRCFARSRRACPARRSCSTCRKRIRQRSRSRSGTACLVSSRLHGCIRKKRPRSRSAACLA